MTLTGRLDDEKARLKKRGRLALSTGGSYMPENEGIGIDVALVRNAQGD